MRTIRYVVFTLLILISSVGSVAADVSVGIGINAPGISIGINLPAFPYLAPVPGYPVYYAPRVSANYFFYDGMYWVFWDDNWYASDWYNGPWWLVEPEFVPVFILRVPVRYYRSPPVYFRHWHSHAPPRWGHHWGPRWEERRRGWDRWDRRAVPTRAPLPAYQRRYSGERYPRLEEQRELRSRNYRYEPRTRVVREHFREERSGSSRQGREGRVEPRESRERQMRGPAPTRQEGPGERRSEQRRDEERFQRQAPVQRPPQERGPDFRGGGGVREQGPRGEDRAPRQIEQRQIERREPSDQGRGRGQMEQRGEDRGGGRGGEQRGGGGGEGRGGGRDEGGRGGGRDR